LGVLQVELMEQLECIRYEGLKFVVVYEGRDATGRAARASCLVGIDEAHDVVVVGVDVLTWAGP
jgi:polyphosphate kinase 2 (PPK2 family)